MVWKSREVHDTDYACHSTGGELNFGHLPYGQSWKRHRTAFTQHFNRAAVGQYLPHIRTTAHKLLADILREPSRIQDHLAL